MQIFTLVESSRVIYYSVFDVTFLQSLEGSNLLIARSVSIPGEMTLENCIEWKLENNRFSKFSANIPSEVTLLHRKAKLLAQVNALVHKVRYPYNKMLLAQDYVYDRKFQEAREFLKNPSEERLKELTYLSDEVEIRKQEPKLVALEIQRQRSDREFIMKSSERARRFLIVKISASRTDEELNHFAGLIIERNFKIPMSVL